jgi:hypothetical protein
MSTPETKRGVKIKKINGRYYAYDMISYWDKTAKKYKKHSVYLGVVSNKETKEYIPKSQSAKEKILEPEIIISFGDSYAINEVVRASCIDRKLKTLGINYDTLMSLVCFKLIKSSAMQYAQVWSNGNYVTNMYPRAEISSQKISEFLKELGNEKIWREFFKRHIADVAGEKTGIIVDSTGMPNEINFPLSAWGNHGGESQQETRLLIVVDKTSGNPLYFRYMAGNIVDVSTLQNTIAELNELGLKSTFALLDAGYYGEENIKGLYNSRVAFMTRLPSNRKLHKQLIQRSSDIEQASNMVIYGERALFIKKEPVDLYGNQGYAYIVCDVRRKGDEANKYLIAAKEDKLSDDEIDAGMNEKGKFVLISSENMMVDEIMPLYYTRQSAEKLFGISKSMLELLPIRTHSIETFRGYLMLVFITLLVHNELKKRLNTKYTVEGALIEMGNLMCKLYSSNTIVCEPTKNMKAIAELLGFMVPMKLGV